MPALNLLETEPGLYRAYLGSQEVGEILALGGNRHCWRLFLPMNGSVPNRFRIVKGAASARFGLRLSVYRWLRAAGLHDAVRRPRKVRVPGIVEGMRLDA